MKLAFLLGGAVGYVLGAKAGRERYEAIVRVARRFQGSQTVQATAGVLQAQIDTVANRARELIAAKVGGGSDLGRANGYHH
jgi:tryptophan synthase beta subunit